MVKRVVQAIVAVVIAAPASTAGPMRGVYVPVLDSADGTPALGAAARSWHCEEGRGSLGDASRVLGTVGDLTPGAAYGAAFFVFTDGGSYETLAEVEVPDSRPPRFAVGYVAPSRRSDGGERPMEMPPAMLAPLPEPILTRVGQDETLAWPPLDPVHPDVVFRYRVLRSPDGISAWLPIADTDTTSHVLEPRHRCGGYFAIGIVQCTYVASSVLSVAVGEPLMDADGDGVADRCDNCASVSNRSQGDHDADGVGDFCDADLATPLLRVTKAAATDVSDELWIDVTLGRDIASSEWIGVGRLTTPWTEDLTDCALPSSITESHIRLVWTSWRGAQEFFLAGTPDFGVRSDGTPRPLTCP